ncbi:hypothetical protein [Paraconexibacter algicola]|uniref:Uncharacterized protein n=1 Tax=Paraconexibacter algicola TaxID=2133960 RepID=A0A2T4UCC4_9ACTN|nr:hypothetical protein [Paraconexibacter algicola]PTL54864.1 hypothetical protein C7Y72_19985 [Paraconexibacter algicola]
MGRGHGLSEDELVRCTTALLTTLAVGLVPVSVASAEEVQIGQKVKGPGKTCAGNVAENDNVKVCFRRDGEYLYVQDKAADGRSAYGQLADRDRHCRNPYGKGTWVRCDYSYREGSTVAFRGYTRDNEGSINIMRNETRYTSELA